MNFKSNIIFVRLVNLLKASHSYILVLLCLISLSFQQGPSSFDAVSKNKTLFIYGFTKNFEWPDEKKSNNFIIYVVGKNDNLVNELKKMASAKKVGEQDIEIKNTTSFYNNINPHILVFTSDNDAKTISELSSKLKNKGSLIISEMQGGCKVGASLNFTYVDSKLKFEYKEDAAKKAGLKTKEEFKKLAIENY